MCIFKQMLINEEKEYKTREKQERAALGQGPSSHQRIHTALSLSCFGDTESTSRWDKFMANDGMLPTNL